MIYRTVIRLRWTAKPLGIITIEAIPADLIRVSRILHILHQTTPSSFSSVERQLFVNAIRNIHKPV